jgi:hypothetical protein
MELDRQLIADAVEHELYSHPDFRGNWSALERESRVSHSTMSRLKRADERVTSSSMRKVEAALGLPFDSLATIGAHDMDGLRELGISARLVQWLEPRFAAAG